MGLLGSMGLTRAGGVMRSQVGSGGVRGQRSQPGVTLRGGDGTGRGGVRHPHIVTPGMGTEPPHGDTTAPPHSIGATPRPPGRQAPHGDPNGPWSPTAPPRPLIPWGPQWPLVPHGPPTSPHPMGTPTAPSPYITL